MAQPRLRLERTLGQLDTAILTIDSLRFTVSRADLVRLAADLLRVLNTFKTEDQP